MKELFIDRDGVINKDPGGWTPYSYVTKWEEFEFLPGSLEALKILKDKGIKVVLISNQAGVGKGYFTTQALDEVTERMVKEIEKYGGKIDAVYYCIHKKEDNCLCRKPRSGLLEKAAKEHGIDCKATCFIGDSIVDVKAGRAAGCKTVFLLSGKTTREEMEEWDEKPDYVFADLLEAVRRLVK
jgi:D-glycero-D-manno-heptose 1,7-bisphosphate phosphatase